MKSVVAIAGFVASFGAMAVSPPPIDGPAAVCLRPDPDRVRAHEFGVTLNIANECFAPLLVRIHSSRGAREILVRSSHHLRYRQGGFACQYYHREPPTCERVEAYLAPFARADLLGAFGIADEESLDDFMRPRPLLEASLAETVSDFFRTAPATTQSARQQAAPQAQSTGGAGGGDCAQFARNRDIAMQNAERAGPNFRSERDAQMQAARINDTAYRACISQ